jgi:hypothetical protein
MNSDTLVKVPKKDLTNILNYGVHVSWIGRKATFRLKEIRGDTAILVSTRGKLLQTHVDYVCYTKKHESRINAYG